MNDKEFKANALVGKEFLNHYGVLGMRWGKRGGGGPASTSKNSTDKQVAKAAAKREKILKSPRKLYKNHDKFSQEEIDVAMKRMKMERELRSLSRDEITAGAQFAESIMKYGTVAVGAYGLYKSPLGEVIRKAL